MTNIKEIIREEYCDEEHDIDTEISGDELTKRLLAYNSKRMDIRKWNSTGLKKLKFNDEIPKQNSTEQQQSSATATPPTLNFNDKSQSNRTPKSIEPNDFHKTIMAMDYETFINETNVKELVQKSFETETEPLNDAAMENELKKLDAQRPHFKRYHKGLLNHLKILQCECRRNKTFQDKWTQTDMVQSQDADAQCDSVEGGSNEIVKPAHDDHLLNSCPSKLNMLTVHEITESEIIQIQSITSTVVPGKIK